MDCPNQVTSHSKREIQKAGSGLFDMRERLDPKRLTIIMWDQAHLMRHIPGGSFEDFDRVLDETVERGYNTVRLDAMLQWIDLKKPERVLTWPDEHIPYFPWGKNSEVVGPAGEWTIEFMEKLLLRKLNYTLSAWWFFGENQGPTPLRRPTNHLEASQVWIDWLHDWEERFGFDGLLYVDIGNEFPFFLGDIQTKFKEATGRGWNEPTAFNEQEIAYITGELNPGLALLQREFPQLRFTCSIHGDPRWADVPLEIDVIDAHFYCDADPRWVSRTRFYDYMSRIYTDIEWHKEFSDACKVTMDAVAPMLRARQRTKLAQFAQWSEERGMPLTTSESWAVWYYLDSPGLDWGWLLEWAEWSVEDAIEFGMWGWTPHNYCQPQFKNWQDVAWHQRLTSKFLNG